MKRRQITWEEWDKLRRHGYTSHIDGVPFILSDEGGKGTCLVPVEIIIPARSKQGEE